MLCFFKEHGEALRSGKGHANHPPSFTMAVTCLFYMAPAWAWHQVGYHRMAMLLTAVTVLSTLADGCQWQHPFIRVVDRIVATIGVIGSVVFNSLRGPVIAILCLGAVISSMWFLRRSRSVSKHRPLDHRAWVWYHGMWHVYGASVLAGITLYAHSHGGPFWTFSATTEGIAATGFFLASCFAWAPPRGAV
jgi:hypothetical protein